MAISRFLMNRQLRADGGIMQVAPREKFGFGSSFKKFVRKIIPNEVAEVAVKAAPFVAPFNPAVAAAMSGIGSFDQTGRIGDSLKSGALTYGLGQGARYLGGAELQGNPFKTIAGDPTSGAFRGGLEGFKGGFSSPLGNQSGFKLGNKPVEEVQGVGVDIDTTVPLKKPIIDNKTFGQKVLDLGKKAGKAIFYDSEGKLDKNILLGAIVGAASYAEAKALADEAGVELSEQEYNDLAYQAEVDAYRKEQAKNFENFFEGKKDGGRIGFESGANEMIKTQLLEELMPDTSTEEMIMIMTETGPKMIKKSDYESMSGMFRDTTTGFGANIKRIERKFGSPEEGESEIGIMAIDVEAGDDEDEEDMMMAGITFSRPEKSYLFRRLGGSGGADRSFTMPQLYRILNNPNKYPDDAAVLKQIAIMGLGEGQKDGGRIGFESGANEMIKEKLMMELGLYPSPEEESSGIGLYPSPITEEEGSEIIMTKDGPVSVKEIFERDTPLSEDLLGMSDGFTLSPVTLLRRYLANKELENKADGGRIGYAKGANRVSELLITRAGILAKDPNADVSDIDGEIFQLTGKTFKSVGGISNIPTGKMRKNNAGVVERDYRDEGGFVPVGIKERADDVPAMLSKNEFVMTADAVRGIGNGSVEEGSKKLYNTMKQAEKVGKA
jgi:hypothetical protein